MTTARRRRFVALIAGAGLAAAAFGTTQASADAENGYHLSSTAYLDLNANGSYDEGEPGLAGSTFFAWRGVSDNNSALWVGGELEGTRAGNLLGGSAWGHLSPIPNSSGEISLEEDVYGAFAFKMAPAPEGCVLGDITVTVDGQPYDPAIEEDPAYVVQEMTVPYDEDDNPLDPVPTVGEDEIVYVLGEDQTDLHFDMPYTCDVPEAAGSVFDDNNGNGVRDEGEAPVTDATVYLDGFTPNEFNDSLNNFAEPAEVQSWFTRNATVDEDGAIGVEGGLYQNAYGMEWDDEAQAVTGPWVSRWDMYVTVPDDCQVVETSNLTPAGEAIAGFDYANQELWLTGTGPWSIAGADVPADAYHRVVEVAWGEDVNVDVALDCPQREPIIEDPIDGPIPTTPDTTVPVTQPDGTVPVTVVDLTPAPASVRIETGESGTADTVALVSGALVLAGAAGAVTALRRRNISG